MSVAAAGCGSAHIPATNRTEWVRLTSQSGRQRAISRWKSFEEAHVTGQPLSLAEVDERLSVVRDNLRDLVEQAAAYSGAAGEELMSERIAEQEAQLAALTERRDELLQGSA